MRTRERDIFRKYLERRGLKLTAERQAVFDQLFARHEHVEADAVHENIAVYDMAQGLALAEPELAGRGHVAHERGGGDDSEGEPGPMEDRSIGRSVNRSSVLVSYVNGTVSSSRLRLHQRKNMPSVGLGRSPRNPQESRGSRRTWRKRCVTRRASTRSWSSRPRRIITRKTPRKL